MVANVSEHNNYMTKVHESIKWCEQHTIPYMMKCDNDIFFTAKTLDYMVDNLGLLETNDTLTIGPTLSSGIPGVEYFASQFLPETDKTILEKKYLETYFYNRDGATYTSLNQFTIGSTSWNWNAFINGINAINHHYKGIHPIRMNHDAINYLNECILQNKEKFFTSEPSGIIRDTTAPYLCDSVFCIKTNIYKEIVNDRSLFVDGYDEVPLNKYAWKHKMAHLFIKEGYGIHILYNWFNNINEYEKAFCSKLFS
jgi:hypothetical protein